MKLAIERCRTCGQEICEGTSMCREIRTPAVEADERAWTEWDAYEDDGPMDLEDQLDNALDRGITT